MIERIFVGFSGLTALALGALCAQSAGAYASAAPSSLSAACTWTGGSGDWHAAANWSCGAVPTANDDAVINTTLNGETTITVNQAAPVKSLTISSGGGVISGTGALNVGGLMSVTALSNLAISTHGSRIPQLQLTADTLKIIRVTDPSLSADSFAAVSLTNRNLGNTVLAVGDHAVGALWVQGSLAIGNNLTVTQSFALDGSLSSATVDLRTLAVASTAVMTVAAVTTAPSINYLHIVNNGRVTQASRSAISLDNGSDWQNNGVLDIRASGSPIALRGSRAPFTNTGTLSINTAGTVNVDWDLKNYGSVEVNGGVLSMVYAAFRQYAGHTRLNGGAIAGVFNGVGLDNAQSFLYGGTLNGSGVVTGGVENSGGTVALDGSLLLTNFYKQSISGTLQVTLTNAGPVGVMSVVKHVGTASEGAATVAGTLIVNAGGGYKPPSGSRFNVITCEAACQGAFQQSIGTLAPAFGGYAGANAVIVAEANNALLPQVKPDSVKGVRSASNGYTISVFNPTTQSVQVTGLTVAIPVSFTYLANSAGGMYGANPAESVFSNRRRLTFSGGVAIAPHERKSVHFGAGIAANAPGNSYPVDLEVNVSGLSGPIKLFDVAAINVSIDSVGSSSISGGTLITQSGSVKIMIHRDVNPANQSGFNVRVAIVCPAEFEPCGPLRGVYLAQKQYGRYINIHLLTLDANQNPLQARGPEAQYGFWTGTVPGGQFYPGLPENIYPDWDYRRPCIAYDYGGGRELGCVDDGDPIGTPELWDPSGVVRDAVTSQPIANATVRLYRIPAGLPDTPALTRDCRTVDTRGGSNWGAVPAGAGGVFEQPGYAPAQISPDVNPQITGGDGAYGWNVVTGCWYVTASAPGYSSTTSALVGVPPAVTDLDFNLQTGGPPAGQTIYLPLVRR